MTNGLVRFVAVAIVTMLTPSCGAVAASCAPVGTWLVPSQQGKRLSADNAISRLAERQVVLLGESHGNADDHRWQLQVLAALHGRRPDLRIGLEMLPRAAQPVLDRWMAGELSVKVFLESVNWDRVWGYNSNLYMPIFEFSRMNQVPLIAINIPRSLVAKVRDEGWAAIPDEERVGVGDPASAPSAYSDMLADVFVVKERMAAGGHEDSAMAPTSDAERMALVDDPEFQRFVEAQLTWDRAMAEALAEVALARTEAPLVVGIVGRGHAEGGHGIAHQLRDLGVDDIGIAVTTTESCANLPTGLADLVFVTTVQEVGSSPGPRLGILIDRADDGVVVRHVVPDSVAAEAGIKETDIITEAAGFALSDPGDLIRIVRRQAPGTWLPLVLMRDGEGLHLVAKFPMHF